MRIKAAVLYRPKENMVIEELDLMPPKEDEVLVRIEAAGVCHSDYARVKGERYAKYPLVLGHEGAGIVEKIGSRVTKVKTGEKVIFSWVTPCGNCFYCKNHLEYLCSEHFKYYQNGTMPDGTTRLRKGDQEIYHFQCLSTFAEYAVVSERACVSIPEDTPSKSACLVGCAVMTGIGSVWNTAGVRPGQSVVVFGIGGVGLNCLQGAKTASAYPIIAVDIDNKKLNEAKNFGVTHTINSKEEDLKEKINQFTNNIGADFAFIAAGVANLTAQAFEIVRRQGTIIVVGMPPAGDKISVEAIQIPYHEKIIKGSFYGSPNLRTDFLKIVNLYRNGIIKLDELVSKTYRLEQINEAFEDLEKGELKRGVILF